MKLPGAEQTVIEPAKLRDYLLSPTHPIGRFKAVFFASLGYVAADWETLRQELQTIALSDQAVEGETTRYGTKYEIHAMVSGPSGKRASLTTVWIVRDQEPFPRFVTAYPGDQP